MNLQSPFQLAAIVLVIAIASVPLWYPRYSLFQRNASAGIDHLRSSMTERTTGDEDDGSLTRISTLRAGDRGFSELVDAICAQSHVADSPVRIELVHTDSDPEYETLVIGGDGVTTGEEAVLRLTYDTGETEPILESPDCDVDHLLDLVDLRRWVTARTYERSHYATTVLVLAWATVSIAALS